MNLSRNEVNYIEKVSRTYSDLSGDLHLVELQRNGAPPPASLGLSLVGTHGNSTMSVFVVDIEPSSLAGLDGGIHVGDEILEVNGQVLHGRSHLNASVIIKGIASTRLKILLLRDKEYFKRIAVDPITRTLLKYKDSSRTLIPKKLTEENEGQPEEGENENTCRGFSPLFTSSLDSGEFPDITEVGENNLSADDMPAEKSELLLKIYDSSDILNENHSNECYDNEISRWVHDKFKLNRVEELRQDTPLQEPVVNDPLTCAISSGKPTLIEIQKGKCPLGVQVIGGADTPFNSIFIFQVYKGGAAFLDGRLAVGDQILKANGECLTDVTNFQAHQILRSSSATLRLVVLRDAFREDGLYDNLTVDLFRKTGGRGLGFSIVSKRDDTGVLIADIIRDGAAEFDGRLMVGDEILSVNGDDVCDARQDDAAHLLKTVTGQVSLSVKRLKVGSRASSLLLNSIDD